MSREDIVSMNKALSKISGLYQKWFQHRTMNSYLIRTLTALYMEPELSQKEISEKYQLPRQTVNNAVKVLEKNRHINLIQDERDKRWKKIQFTISGQKFAEESLAPLLQLDEHILARMGAENYSQLTSLLVLYGQALEQEVSDSVGG